METITAQPASTGTNEHILFKINEVIDYTGIKRSTWLAGVKRGIYPAPVKLTVRLRAWRKTDLDGFLAGLTA